MVMKFFPLTILDDFFENPDEVLKLAEEVDYQNTGQNSFPGQVSNLTLDKINFDIFFYTMKRILSLYWEGECEENFQVTMQFHKILPHDDSLLNKGIIHHDFIQNEVFSGVIYLNENAIDSGTSFFELKEKYQNYNTSNEFFKHLETTKKYHGGIEESDLKSILRKHRNKFQETMRVQSKKNRMVLYPSGYWHSQTTYGQNTRYTIRYFCRSDSTGKKFPISRV
tara:strand:+ start:432 stop:1103 length:672 start_codon:yes stop_codon:yes gene_type:complete